VSTQKIAYLLIGVALGFVVGFIFTNSVNRREHDALRAEVARMRGGSGSNALKNDGANGDARGAINTNNSSEQRLTEEELRKAVAKGDDNPQDIALQRKLGQGLYLYAINFGSPALLSDAARMLKRAYDVDPKDFETTAMLGNVFFDLGQQDGNASRIAEARGYFQKALEIKPDDPDARTALGLTYFFDKPPDTQRAVKEYRKSLALNPKHELALQSLAAALMTEGELAEARQKLDELQRINPSNTSLADLRAQLAQKTNAAGVQMPGGAKERE
jgi:tetratricopeptide (TPR) repeat protein